MFPYRHLSMTEGEVWERFENLKWYEFNLVKSNYKINNIPGYWYKNKNWLYHNQLIKVSDEDYLKYNAISEYFTDECRMCAKRYDRVLTPLEYWEKHHDFLVHDAIIRYGCVNAYTLREAIYHLAGEVTAFRPTLMVGFIKLFKAKRILDFSAGWGDRLIGAMAADVSCYTGYDPNKSLYPKYIEMIKFFKNSKNIELFSAPFESSAVPTHNYDLVLTSPPYWDLEKYCSESTQSTETFKNLESWFKGFLMTCLYKSWERLVVGGHMVIIINDVRNHAHYVKRMVDEFNQKQTNACMLGVLSYGKNPQPCWIWKKI